MLVGLVHRPAVDSWLRLGGPPVECLELPAESFYKVGRSRLTTLSAAPLLVHGAGLSLGTPGPSALQELDWFAGVVALASPLWISADLAFRRAGGADVVRPTPFPLTEDSLARVTDRVHEVSERCERRLLVSNVSSPLQLPGALREADFLSRLAEATGCGIRLCIGALVANTRNAGDPAESGLDAIPPELVVQLHLTGVSERHGFWFEARDQTPPDEAWDLAAELLEGRGVRAVVLEPFADRDQTSLALERARSLAHGNDAVAPDPAGTTR